jgi:steroid Delta-isomerase
MPGPAVDIIKRFGAVEDDQRYTKLVDLFTDDGVYYDPFFGPQRGKAAIHEFMTEMEKFVPASGAYFDEWEVEADTNTAWARWTMWANGSDGTKMPVKGQSVYRLADNKVTFAADYLDTRDYAALRPGGKTPNLAAAAGLSANADAPGGTALAVVKQFWSLQDSGRYTELAALFSDDSVFTDVVYGEFHGIDAVSAYLARMESQMAARSIRFELIDCAGDETVAWSQWTCHMPNGSIPGWTLHKVRDGKITLDSDYFDVVAAVALGGNG